MGHSAVQHHEHLVTRWQTWEIHPTYIKRSLWLNTRLSNNSLNGWELLSKCGTQMGSKLWCALTSQHKTHLYYKLMCGWSLWKNRNSQGLVVWSHDWRTSTQKLLTDWSVSYCLSCRRLHWTYRGNERIDLGYGKDETNIAQKKDIMYQEKVL